MINDVPEQIILAILLVSNKAVRYARCSSSPERINPDCRTEHVQLNSNYGVLIFHYTCPSWLARRATRRATLNNWTIMESGMRKAYFLSRQVSSNARWLRRFSRFRESNVVFTIAVMLPSTLKVTFTREPTSDSLYRGAKTRTISKKLARSLHAISQN